MPGVIRFSIFPGRGRLGGLSERGEKFLVQHDELPCFLLINFNPGLYVLRLEIIGIINLNFKISNIVFA